MTRPDPQGDQRRAAESETMMMLGRAADAEPSVLGTHGNLDQLPPWVREITRAHDRAVTETGGGTCVHRNVAPVGPMMGAAHVPGVLVCPQCAYLLDEAAARANWQPGCVVCGPSPDEDAEIFPCQIRLGSTIMVIVTCQRHRDELAAHV